MSTGRLALRVLFIAAVSGAGALAMHGSRHALRHGVAAQYHRDLRRLEALDARLDRELLRSRAGLVMHYDTLTSAFRELRSTAGRVARVPELGFDPGPELHAALGRVDQLIREQELSLERFKSVNAILRNSRQYYPVLLDEVRGSSQRTPGAEVLRPSLEAVMRALAHFDAAPASDAVALLASALSELESASRALPPLSASVRDEIDLVSQHGHIIVDHFAGVDQLVGRVLALPLSDEISRATASYEQGHAAALRRDTLQASLLATLIASAIVLGLVEVVARARADARALRDAKGELERANRALEHERQREQQQNELKTRFVSATSHEFRTPLTTILSSSQMLATYGERWGAERRMTHFERITTAAHHMTEMLEELLLIGRAEMGVLAAQPVELDLRDFCKGLIETLSRAAARQGSIELSLSGPGRVLLDQRLLTHVLGNLLENAMKYSEPGSRVCLQVSAEASGVRCVVSDAGVGIPESDIPRLFDSFYRGQNVGSAAGSGLGLAVVKRAVDVQGGSIEVQSECGHGTTVSVWLPHPSNAAPSPESGPPSVESRPSAVATSPSPFGPGAAIRSANRNA